MARAASDRLHVAFVGSGTSYHVAKWLPALVEEGLDVTLFSFETPEKPLPGVGFVPLDPPYARWTRRLSWFDFFGPADRLREMLRSANADVVIGSYATNYGAMTARAVRGTGLPLVIQTWTLDLSTYPVEGLRRFVLRPVVRRTLESADLITTDGAALAQYARSAHPDLADRVVSVRWGIRLSEFGGYPTRRKEARAALGIPEDAVVVTAVRGVDPVYRPGPKLDALAEVVRLNPAVHAIVLTLAQPRSPQITAQLDTLGRLDRVRVIDRFLSRQEVADVWFASDFAVSVPEMDGISEALLETMYCGVIPVVSDIPSNRSFLNEEEGHGLFVPGCGRDATDAALRGALVETLTQAAGERDALRSAVVARNRAWVAEKASVQGTARFLAEHLERLADTSSSNPPPAQRRIPTTRV